MYLMHLATQGGRFNTSPAAYGGNVPVIDFKDVRNSPFMVLARVRWWKFWNPNWWSLVTRKIKLL